MNKKIIILSGSLFVLAMGIFLSERFVTKKPDPRLGKSLVDATSIVGLDTIVITKQGEILKLVNDSQNTWRLSDTDGFPADATKISRLLDDLTRMNAEVLVSAAKEPSSEFGLDEATNLTLQRTGKEVLNLKLAKARDRGGQFVSFGDDAKVYLIPQPLTVDVKSATWELKTLVNIPAAQVQKITFAAKGKKKVTLKREKAEDPIKAEGLTGKDKESSSIRSHESILTGLNFSERLSPNHDDFKKAMAAPSLATIDLFDGRHFEVKIGSTGEVTKRYFIWMSAKSGEKTSESDAKEIANLNKMMEQHVFELQTYMALRFEKGLEDMIEKKGS